MLDSEPQLEEGFVGAGVVVIVFVSDMIAGRQQRMDQHK